MSNRKEALEEFNNNLPAVCENQDEIRVYIEKKETKQLQLFPNPINNDQAFAITREVADKLKGIMDEITPEAAEASYKYKGTTFEAEKKGLALRVKDGKQEIRTFEQFYDALSRIKNGKVLQTFLALWNYANMQGGFVFSGTRLTEIMRTVLKTKTGYFSQSEKRDFTEAIYQLRDLEILLDQTITDTDARGRKQKVIKRDFYKLIDLKGATYAKRKRDVVDPKTGEVIYKKGTADDSVIIKLYGELSPGYNKGIMRGRLYSKGLLELDANKDERAIILGFKLSTRFDQLRMGKSGKDKVSDDKLFIRLDRKTLIEEAGYTKTDLEDKWLASQYLKKTLDKLVEVNCLRDYEPKDITTADDLKIILYPSEIALKPAKDDRILDKIKVPGLEGKEQGEDSNF